MSRDPDPPPLGGVPPEQGGTPPADRDHERAGGGAAPDPAESPDPLALFWLAILLASVAIVFLLGYLAPN